ncbi:hypothetical protein [Pseudoalteromonas sp. 68 DY56-GL68]|uniref:hypothetical protein n=1 Tax=Pseudoalteromonas sp. 68 DY56-GL68 TaxID=2974919 RepID=UPI003529F5B8
MKLPSKTVPTTDGEGTVPLSNSRNPVLGVFKHHCGTIASVHQPKGKRKNTLYLICEECGVDQCNGAIYQEKIRAQMRPTIEDLLAENEAVEVEAAQVEAIAVDTPKPTDTAEIAAYSALGNTEQAETLTEKQAEPLAEKTVKSFTDNLAFTDSPSKPTEINDNAVSEPKTEADTQTEKPANNKPKRIAIAAGIGALFGSLLALRA